MTECRRFRLEGCFFGKAFAAAVARTKAGNGQFDRLGKCFCRVYNHQPLFYLQLMNLTRVSACLFRPALVGKLSHLFLKN